MRRACNPPLFLADRIQTCLSCTGQSATNEDDWHFLKGHIHENPVAVVTGANRGLGRAFVEQLLARGAKRIYAGARDPSKLRDVASSSRGRVVALRIDLGDPASIVSAAKTAKDATLLINN